MAKIEKNDLGYLGFDFQSRLCLQLVTDKKFAKSIIDIIDPNYFEDPFLRIIGAAIKDAYEQYEIIPDMGSLEARLLESVKDDTQRRFVITQLRKVQEADLNDTLWVQDTSMKFCKQQELKKSVREIQKIIDKGDINNYEQCEAILRKALEHGIAKDDGLNVCDNMDEVLADDFRKPIPTGIKCLDEIMNGGLSKGELAVILAALGVGKTTTLTKIANTAKNLGNNVLQIFFEDMPMVVQRKHLACWSGIELNSLTAHKEDLKLLAIKKASEPGILKLKKFPSVGTTIPIIRQYIRKQIAQGFRPDIILLDYIDCVEPSRRIDDVNVGEGAVMREFEAMLAELEIAGWTAIQGNRSSIKSEVVEADQMGGSIKKAQIGHFILSIARTLDQKDNGTATMAILKSRFGKDGMIFQNILFDNARIIIDMDENKRPKTQTEHKKDTEVVNQNRINMVFEASKNRQNVINMGVTTPTVENVDNNK